MTEELLEMAAVLLRRCEHDPFVLRTMVHQMAGQLRRVSEQVAGLEEKTYRQRQEIRKLRKEVDTASRGALG